MRIAIHSLILNIFFFCFFALFVKDRPSYLFVTIDSDSPTTFVEPYSARGMSFGQGVNESHIWLPIDYHETILSLSRLAGHGAQTVVDAYILHNFFVKEQLKHQDLQDANKIRFDRKSSKFGIDYRFWVFMGVVETFIICCSMMMFWLSGVTKCRWEEESLYRVLYLALGITLFCQILTPIQTYLQNAGEFDLNILHLVYDLSWRSVLYFLGVSLGVGLAVRYGGRVYFLLCSSFLLYLYLETGVLSMGLPEYVGDVNAYRNLLRAVCDLLCLPVIFASVCILSKFINRLDCWIVSIVLILSVSSLFDANRSSGIDHNIAGGRNLVDGLTFRPKFNVVRNASYSTRKNVLVYVLDSLSLECLQDVLNQDAEFRDSLQGFVCFTNNLGMYGTTVEGTAGLCTGKYYERSELIGKYVDSLWTKDSFVCDYIASNSVVSFCPGSFSYAADNSVGSSDYSVSESDKDVWKGYHYRIKGQQPWNLSEVTRNRLLPFGLKYFDYIFNVGGWNGSKNIEDERICYRLLKDLPLNDSDLTLQFWHTIGAHGPYGINRDGIDDGEAHSGKFYIIEKALYSCRELCKLLKSLKNRGLYDCSFIVITADHGVQLSIDDHSKYSQNSRKFPCLCVKPVNAYGKLVFSSAPTSHSKLHDLFVSEITANGTLETVINQLSATNRFFRKVNGREVVDTFGLNIHNLEENKIELKLSDEVVCLGKEYRLSCRVSSESVPILFKNCSFMGAGDSLVFYGDKTGKRMASLSFRVSESNQWYHIRFICESEDDFETFRVIQNSQICPVFFGKNRDLEFDLVSDDNGIVSFDMASDVLVKFLSVLVNK